MAKVKIVTDPSNPKAVAYATDFKDVDKKSVCTLTAVVDAPQGYELGGWDVLKGDAWVEETDGGEYVLHTGYDDIVIIYPVWSPLSYTLTIDPAGGEYGDDTQISGIKHNDIVQLATPQLEGRTFTHWIDENGEIYDSIFTYGIGDLRLQAQYELNVCKVLFCVGGLGIVSPSSKDVTYSGTYGELPTPKSNNYTFNGWYDTPECDGTQITSASTLNDDVKTKRLYAKWTLNSGASATDFNSSMSINYALFMLTEEEAADPVKTGWAYAFKNSDRWVQMNGLLKEQVVDPDWSRDTLAFVFAGKVYDIYKDYIDCDSGTRVFVLKPSLRGADLV